MTAFSGLLLALSVVCMALGSVIETNTLFLLAAASYFVGIIIREFGMKAGVAFYLADILLGFLVTPNKFYVISFAAMGFYILATEGSWRFLGKSGEKMQKSWIFWVMKYMVFNLMYIPMVLIFQELLFMKELSGGLLLAVLAAGQVGVWIYDRAYEYVQVHIWNKFRGKLLNLCSYSIGYCPGVDFLVYYRHYACSNVTAK